MYKNASKKLRKDEQFHRWNVVRIILRKALTVQIDSTMGVPPNQLNFRLRDYTRHKPFFANGTAHDHYAVCCK